jgi:hypothetical protein
MPMNEQQLSALIDAAVREAVERTTRELATKFETDTAGLRRNRDELLAEKKDGEGKQPSPDNFDEWLAGVDERLRKSREESDRLLGKRPGAAPPPVREHTISREDARSGQAYREAKAAAEKAGVPLRIVDGDTPAVSVNASPVRIIHDETGGLLHVNKRLINSTPGGLPRLRQLAAEKNAQLRLFKTVDDLPTDAAAKHAEVIAAQDRDNLLGDDQ